MIHKVSIASLMALVFLGALCAPVAPAAFTGANGKIAFTQSGQIRVVNPDGSGETAIRQGWSPDWSADGAAIAFEGGFNGQAGIWRMPADGSSQTLVQANSDTFDGPWFYDPSWSPDGFRIAMTREMNFTGEFVETVVTVKSDGTGDRQSVAGSAIRPSWSPAGDSIAFIEAYPDFYLSRIRVDRTGYTTLYGDEVDDLDWSPDGTRIVFSTRGPYDVYVIPSAGGTPTQLTSGPAIDADPAWSPDGSQIVFSSNRDGDYEIYRMKADGSNVVQVTHNTVSDTEPDWQPVTGGYARPKGAHPLRMSLVVAYPECTSPNAVHGPPLEHPSCTDVAQVSPNATVGTADSNGGAANFVGSVRLSVATGDPATPADEADVLIHSSMQDVRCHTNAALCGDSTQMGPADYVGELQARFGLRITDRDNTAGPEGPGPGTVEDIDFRFTVPCTETTGFDPVRGSDCAVTTSADALVPGVIAEGRRAIWQVDQVEVLDGGPDGDVDTPADSHVFLRQGIFSP